MHKKYDARRVKNYQSYTIAELCMIYDDHKLHAQTIREWARDGKLEVMRHNNKIYIYGAVWNEFVQKNNAKNKYKLKFKELKCCKCKAICHPLDNQIIDLQIANSGGITAFVYCSVCGHKNRRLYKRLDYQALKRAFIVLQDNVAILKDSCNSPSKTHLQDHPDDALSESSIKHLENSANSLCKTHLITQNLTPDLFEDLL